MSTKTGQNGDSPAIHPVSLDISAGQDMYLPKFFGHMARFLWTYRSHERRFARNFWTYRIEPESSWDGYNIVQKGNAISLRLLSTSMSSQKGRPNLRSKNAQQYVQVCV